MHGDLSIKLLEIINNVVTPVTDIGEAFLRAGYGASISRLEYEHRKLDRRREARAEWIREKGKYYKLLSKLKREGFISEQIIDQKKVLKLTIGGKKKLITLKKNQRDPLPDLNYQKTADKKFTIITFDVPEKERRKRDWLRSVLVRLGFQNIQKSVWIGQIKIPPDFIKDLAELKMTDYVEILQINKSGSLKHLA
jgi:CRISPR/Cas system-associated endoribonuclease Cas2